MFNIKIITQQNFPHCHHFPHPLGLFNYIPPNLGILLTLWYGTTSDTWRKFTCNWHLNWIQLMNRRSNIFLSKRSSNFFDFVHLEIEKLKLPQLKISYFLSITDNPHICTIDNFQIVPNVYNTSTPNVFSNKALLSLCSLLGMQHKSRKVESFLVWYDLSIHYDPSSMWEHIIYNTTWHALWLVPPICTFEKKRFNNNTIHIIHNNHGGCLLDILPVKRTARYFIEQCHIEHKLF